jgi:amino acid adenylation domain-containing protein
MTEEVGGNQEPAAPWGSLSTAERSTLEDWNATTAPYPATETLVSLFLAQAERTPDALAYEAGDRTLTYAELRIRAGQVAQELRTIGVTEESIVGVCLPRSLDAVVALLGVLLAGGAFLPLDPQYPTERLRFMLGDSHAAALISTSALRARLGAETLAWLDIARPEWPPLGAEHWEKGVRPDSLAYVIYTSGSTGIPKGVTGLHRATVNRFHWMWTTYPFVPGERGCQKTVLSFADSIWEIFGPLLMGVPTVIVSDEEARDARRLVAAMAAQRVTRLVVVPSLLAAMLDAEPELGEKLRALRWLVSSGEALPLELARRLRRALPECGILNLYGSTEVAADVTYFEVPATAAFDSIPIGRPIANTTAYVLDEALRPVPPGVEGELFIGGVGLSRGYLYREELTAQRFLPDPFSRTPGARLFRTGDRVRYRSDGQLEYLGRLDQQKSRSAVSALSLARWRRPCWHTPQSSRRQSWRGRTMPSGATWLATSWRLPAAP